MAMIALGTDDLDRHPERFTVEALAQVLPQEWVREALQDPGVAAVGRRRKLPGVLTTWLVVLLGLFRNLSYVNLLEMVFGAGAGRGLWRGAGPPESSALSRARDRLGVAPLRRLFERSAAAWSQTCPGRYFHGRRVHALDGTCARVPDSAANAAHFGRPGSSRGRAGYPQLRIALLEDVGARITRCLGFAPYAVGEVTLARQMLASMPPGSLVLMDRLYVVYDLLHDLQERGIDFLVRVRGNLGYHVVEPLGPGDAIVRVDLPRHWQADRPDLPRECLLREVRFPTRSGQQEIVLLTNLLLAEEIPARDIAEEGARRWDVETQLDELKTHQSGLATITRPTLFRSKTPDRIAQELYALFLAHNAVRVTMARAAQQRPTPTDPHRVSFVAGLERVREAVRDMMQLPTTRLAQRYARLGEAIGRLLVPLRPGRHYPRAVKVKMSGYPLKVATATP